MKQSIECDSCKEWAHTDCVGLEQFQVDELETFYCQNCQKLGAGPSKMKPFTNDHRHNRTEPDAHRMPTQAGTPRHRRELLKRIQEGHFKELPSVLIEEHRDGTKLKYNDWVLNGFTKPILVRNVNGLGLRLPRDLSLEGIQAALGEDWDIEVIIVDRQHTIKMKLGDFIRHMQKQPEEREEILNCISMELSFTPLEHQLTLPTLVQKACWVTNWFPPHHQYQPHVSKYCLLSEKDSYTDFHIDFGGTSVWYHIVRGSKIFFLIPPTKRNLEAYEVWNKSPSRNEEFFGDYTIVKDECYILRLSAGETMLIPTGWIHAVYTLEDSLVFGGNFLHSLNIRLQLEVYDIEKRDNTPDNLAFPHFEMAHWYAAPNVAKQLTQLVDKKRFPPHLVESVKELHLRLEKWLKEGEKIQDSVKKSELLPQCLNHVAIIKNLKSAHRRAITLQKKGSDHNSPKKTPNSTQPSKDFGEEITFGVEQLKKLIENGVRLEDRVWCRTQLYPDDEEPPSNQLELEKPNRKRSSSRRTSSDVDVKSGSIKLKLKLGDQETVRVANVPSDPLPPPKRSRSSSKESSPSRKLRKERESRENSGISSSEAENKEQYDWDWGEDSPPQDQEDGELAIDEDYSGPRPSERYCGPVDPESFDPEVQKLRNATSDNDYYYPGFEDSDDDDMAPKGRKPKDDDKAFTPPSSAAKRNNQAQRKGPMREARKNRVAELLEQIRVKESLNQDASADKKELDKLTKRDLNRTRKPPKTSVSRGLPRLPKGYHSQTKSIHGSGTNNSDGTEKIRQTFGNNPEEQLIVRSLLKPKLPSTKKLPNAQARIMANINRLKMKK